MRKVLSLNSLLTILFIILHLTAFPQKKYDKALSKVDNQYNLGDFLKASKKLQKFKKNAIEKLGQQNSYMPGCYIKEAKINLSLGDLKSFDASIQSALTASKTLYGDTNPSYAITMLDVTQAQNDYGNYRLAREQLEQAKDILKKSNQLNEELNGRIALLEAEAMIGQGFCNNAIDLLLQQQDYFASHAVEKETLVENGAIKTRRLPEEEIYKRFGNYAKLLMFISNAYGKKGNLISADSSFSAAQTWIKKNQRFLGETNIANVQNNYLYSKMLADNGAEKISQSELKFDNILLSLRRKTNPTNLLAHDIYLDFLKDLMRTDNGTKYHNVKVDYEKVISKNFPKSSVHRLNLKAIEFNSKLNRDKTKDLEHDALEILNSKALPKIYKTTIQTLEFLFEVALIEKKYANAESYITQLSEIKKELCGEASPEYHLSLIKVACFYLDYTNKIEEAAKIFKESYVNIIAKEIGPWQKDHLDILNHLATLYELTDKYKDAGTTLNTASDIARSKYRDTDPLYAVELNNIAKLQLKLGEYEKAEVNINKALKILEEKRKEDQWVGSYVNAIETQAILFGIKGLFDDAEDNLDRSRKIISKYRILVGDELAASKELSSLFIQLGRYAETNNLLNKLIFESEQLFGKNSLHLIEPLVEKGRILLAKGDYTEAESIAERANEIAIKTYGENSTKTAPTQRLLSDIYYTLGDFDKAEVSIAKALISQEKQFGRNHIEVAKSLSQLALIKFYKGGSRDQVEKLMLESRDIMAAKLGKENPQYAEILKNVAVLYISEKKYDIAFNSLTLAESIWRAKTGSKKNIHAASIYTLTGDVYYQLKNYPKAEEFYNQAKDLYEKYFSKTHPEYVKVLSKLSKTYYMEKDYKHAKRLIEESLADYENFIKLFFPALSEREKAKYWNTIKGDFEFYNTLAFGNLEDFKDLAGKVYSYQLLTKAMLLSSSIKIRERILNSTDEALKAEYSDWVQKKEKLTLALSLSPEQLTQNEIDPAVLQQEVEQLEKNLSQKSELFGAGFDNKKITFDDVRKSLKPNEVAIEMVRYRYFNHTFTDSVIYAALYLRNELSKPKVIMLKDGQKMETRYFKYYRNAITGKVHDNISFGIYWEPISSVIGQASTVYLSADGIYNQINIEAIPSPEGKYVIDNANIVLVSNTKDLFIRKVKSREASKENTASMFGNPSFYLTASADQTVASLPGTEKEIDQLQFMLKQKGWIASEYVDKSATEEKIKEMNSPKIFHIATHGFYKPTEQITLEEEIEGNESVLAQNPLMRTGLLLKGAGDLLDKTSYNYNMDNGILTAYEAMSLNLDKTDLVVLSACETGLGELQAGEGVYGLQRAFLVAGAKVLIMSMFKVDDDATQKLMLKFYQKWLNTGDLRQSFIDAKKELRIEYPEPIYWGAFMMIGLD